MSEAREQGAASTVERVIPYAVGICSASVCAANAVPVDEIEREVNAQHPTGIASRWEVALDEATFANGDPHPRPCDREPDARRHWLLHC